MRACLKNVFIFLHHRKLLPRRCSSMTGKIQRASQLYLSATIKCTSFPAFRTPRWVGNEAEAKTQAGDMRTNTGAVGRADIEITPAGRVEAEVAGVEG